MAKDDRILELMAPTSGKAMPLEQVKDPIFSQKMMGDGIGIEPDDGGISAPISGRVEMIADTKHAIGFVGPGNVQVLIHLGIDTVELKGEPYEFDVKVGDTVNAGDEIGSWNLQKVRDAHKQTTVMMVITNTKEVLKKLELESEIAEAGKPIVKIELKEEIEPKYSVDVEANEDRFSRIARQVISDVGGKDNINSVIHCISRLRFYLKDENIPKDDEIRNVDGVIDVRRAQGQYQVVIGPEVPDVYEAAINQLGDNFADEEATAKAVSETTPNNSDQRSIWKKTLDGFNSFIGVITGSMSPVIWSLAAAGILKGLLSVLTMPQLGQILAPKSELFVVLNAMGGSAFFFLPILVGYSAAKRIGGDPIIAAVIGGVLVHPTLTALAGKSIGNLGGMNFPMVSYSYSIFPMILAAWLAFKCEGWLKKQLPSYLTMILVPLITVLVVSGITLYITGPVIIGISKWLATGIAWILLRSGWVSGVLIGGFYQLLVIFGLHWGIVPLVANDIATTGHSYLNAIICQTMISQGAAVLAVAIKSRKANLKSLSFAAAISAFCGVTEPAIYGVNLRFRRVFISGLIGSAFGGFITGLFHGNMFGFAGSWIGFASFFDPKNPADLSSFWIFLVSSIVSTIIGFAVAYVWGYSDKMQKESEVERPINPGKK